MIFSCISKLKYEKLKNDSAALLRVNCAILLQFLIWTIFLIIWINIFFTQIYRIYFNIEYVALFYTQQSNVRKIKRLEISLKEKQLKRYIQSLLVRKHGSWTHFVLPEGKPSSWFVRLIYFIYSILISEDNYN